MTYTMVTATYVLEDTILYGNDSMVRNIIITHDENLYFTVSDMGHNESFIYPPDIRLTAKDLKK